MLNIRCVFLFVTVVAVFLLKKIAFVGVFRFGVGVYCCLPFFLDTGLRVCARDTGTENSAGRCGFTCPTFKQNPNVMKNALPYTPPRIIHS